MRAANVLWLTLACVGTAPLVAQTKVPFVGCRSDGQQGPVKAPVHGPKSVPLSAAVAARLAFYGASYRDGVLGPRGWFCFATYGSGGTVLYVVPQPVTSKQLFSDAWKGFTGPAIQLTRLSGDTSGRFAVAEIIARVFPARMSFVRDVIAEGIEPASEFPVGPYPADRLVYRSRQMVEFITPAGKQGLGTSSRLLQNDQPITGFAALLGPETDLVQLSIRLPPELHELAATIVAQAERHELSFQGGPDQSQ